jgi:lysophospholipase
MHDHSGVADMTVLTSPMIDIFESRLPKGLIKLITKIAIKAGFRHFYTIGSRDYTDEKFKGNDLTSDPVRFTDAKNAIKNNPDLALGGATYGWLSATLKSIDILTQPGFAEEISTPILMVIAGNDKIVSIKAQNKICTMLPNCKLKEISGARHEIFKETDSVRSIFWREFNRFTHAE